jgi:hypothetical protein
MSIRCDTVFSSAVVPLGRIKTGEFSDESQYAARLIGLSRQNAKAQRVEELRAALTNLPRDSAILQRIIRLSQRVIADCLPGTLLAFLILFRMW